jgi:hypothetical protein
MTADDTPDTDMTTTTLIPATNASPSAPNWADTVDDDDADDDASTVLADPDVPLKEYSIQAQFRLPRQSAPSHIHFFKDLAAEMMRLDPFLKSTPTTARMPANSGLWPVPTISLWMTPPYNPILFTPRSTNSARPCPLYFV